nr:transcription elongation factor GreA [Flavobacteriales bacterium]
MSSPAYYTEEGYKKLVDELNRLKTVERPHISQQIADARDKGDLSENAEYHAAKEEQGLLEARIAKLEEVVANARIIDDTQVDTSRVYIHTRVMVRHVENKSEREFMIVAESEADVR